MLLPNDYGKTSLFDKTTRALMDKIHFVHGGPKYDKEYPKGIPTSITIEMKDKRKFDSGMVMFPGGHAANQTVDLNAVLTHKFAELGKLALAPKDQMKFVKNLESIQSLSNKALQNIYDCKINFAK